MGMTIICEFLNGIKLYVQFVILQYIHSTIAIFLQMLEKRMKKHICPPIDSPYKLNGLPDSYFDVKLVYACLHLSN